MRLASFNVENLFDRPKAMNSPDWGDRAAILGPHAELTALLEHDNYDAAAKERILELLATLRILSTDEGPYVWLRKVRGQLLRRPKTGTPSVIADGRDDWIGWVELKTEPVNALAMKHTAMVIRDINADVLGVVEAENRPVLSRFTETLLHEVGGIPYPHVMLIDGNDDRGIDVGLLSRHPIASIVSHVDDNDGNGRVFSRDCPEYHLTLPSGAALVVLVNHLKSKGYATQGDPIGTQRRTRQTTAIADIYHQLTAAGATNIAVIGDLNDTPESGPLQILADTTDLQTIAHHPSFDPGPRTGTFKGTKDQIDHILLSPALYATITNAGIFRTGVWRGPTTRNRWDIYDSMTNERHAASDHAAIWVDLDLG